jgi:hypothetical protein
MKELLVAKPNYAFEKRQKEIAKKKKKEEKRLQKEAASSNQGTDAQTKSDDNDTLATSGDSD